jgi:adenosine deaminase
MNTKPTTSKATKSISIDELGKRLLRLQYESAQVQTLVIQTNEKEYKNLSEMYIWWRAAATVPHYLEEVVGAD